MGRPTLRDAALARLEHQAAEYSASYAFVAPTGVYTGGSITASHVVARDRGGTTVYLDEKISWHASALASYEMHQNKADGDIKVGDILTIEGGVGKTMLKGGLNLGAVYYAQWKVTADSGADLPGLLQRFGVENAKHRAYALGPEVSLVVPKLEGQFNVRALKEFGNRTASNGTASWQLHVLRGSSLHTREGQESQPAAPSLPRASP